MSDTVGVEIAPVRFVALAAVVRRILDDPPSSPRSTELAELLGDAIGPLAGQRLPTPLPDQVARVPRRGADPTRPDQRGADRDRDPDRGRQAAQAPRPDDDRPADRSARRPRIADHDGYVDFVSGSPEWPRLEIAPLDVGPTMRDGVWDSRTAILTSATIPSSLAERVGLPVDGTDVADVGSPFDYPANALLYCAMHLPDPRSDKFRAGGARGAGRADHRRRRAHARAVHELAGDGRRRGRGAGDRAVHDPHPARPAQAGARPGLRRRRRDLPVRDRRAVPGRRRARVDALARRDRPDPVPPARRSVAVGAARAARPGGVRPDRPAAGGDAAGAGVRPPDPHRRPTEASSPCSIPDSPRLATDGTSSAPSRRCAALGTAPRPRSSSARWSPRRRLSAPATTDYGRTAWTPSLIRSPP